MSISEHRLDIGQQSAFDLGINHQFNSAYGQSLRLASGQVFFQRIRIG